MITKPRLSNLPLRVQVELEDCKGVYAIVNLQTGKRYIGATRDSLYKRANHHRAYLRRGDHNNWYLQQDWNSYGPTTFVFEVLETVEDITTLTKRELHWIEHYDQDMLYNIHVIDPNTPKGVKRRPETIARKHKPHAKASHTVRRRRIEKIQKAMEESKAAFIKKIGRPLLTTKEAAIRKGVSPETVSKWCQSGKLKLSVRWGRRTWMVDQDELDAMKIYDMGKRQPPGQPDESKDLERLRDMLAALEKRRQKFLTKPGQRPNTHWDTPNAPEKEVKIHSNNPDGTLLCSSIYIRSPELTPKSLANSMAPLRPKLSPPKS